MVLRGEREIVGVPIPCVTLGIGVPGLHIPHLYSMQSQCVQSGQALKSYATASYVRNAHKGLDM